MGILQGYKVVNENYQTRNGEVCEEGAILEIEGKIAYRSRGFHFALHLEDTLRFVNAFQERIHIARVTALGDLLSYEDYYYGYNGLYVTNRLRIDSYLTREEIVNYALSLDDFALSRFLSLFPLTEEEITLFASKSYAIQNIIKYYQLGETDVYQKRFIKRSR